MQAVSSSPAILPILDVKRASRADMPRVARFIQSSADWYREFVAEKDMSEHEPDRSWQERNFRRREFYLGHDGRQPVGTLSIQDFGEYLYLGYVYLDTKHVGKGFGRSLLAFAVEQACARGKRGMVLLAHPEATWAIRAYEKFGFRKIAAEKSELLAWNGGTLQDYYEEGFHLYRYEV